MIVVPDAGPLICLSGAGELELLRAMYSRVVIPRVVHTEVVVAGAGLVGSAEVAAASWIEVQEAEPDLALALTLGVGEAAAIPLAERLSATLLCDDGDARAIARRRGLDVVGTLGVLLRAKRQGRVALIAPVVLRLKNLGMFISPAVLSAVLEAAGES